MGFDATPNPWVAAVPPSGPSARGRGQRSGRESLEEAVLLVTKSEQGSEAQGGRRLRRDSAREAPAGLGHSPRSAPRPALEAPSDGELVLLDPWSPGASSQQPQEAAAGEAALGSRHYGCRGLRCNQGEAAGHQAGAEAWRRQ